MRKIPNPQVPGVIPALAAVALALVIMPGYYFQAATAVVNQSQAEQSLGATNRVLLTNPDFQVGEDGFTALNPDDPTTAHTASQVVVGSVDGSFASTISSHGLTDEDQPVTVTLTHAQAMAVNGGDTTQARVEVTSPDSMYNPIASSMDVAPNKSFDVDHTFDLDWTLNDLGTPVDNQQSRPTVVPTGPQPEVTPTGLGETTSAIETPTQAVPNTPSQVPTVLESTAPSVPATGTSAPATTMPTSTAPETTPPVDTSADVRVFCVAVTVTHMRERLQDAAQTTAYVPRVTTNTATLTVVVGEGWRQVAEQMDAGCSEFEPVATPDGETHMRPLIATDADGVALDEHIDDMGERYVSAGVDEPMHGVGFTYVGNEAVLQHQFHLIYSPVGATATYRNGTVPVPGEREVGTEPVILAPAEPRADRVRMIRGMTQTVRHRVTPSRDLFATWTFSEPGVYCVGYGARPMPQAGGAAELKDFDGFVKFAVGEADPSSVNCGLEALERGSTLDFPFTAPYLQPGPTPTPSASAEPTGSATATPSVTASTEPTPEVSETAGATASANETAQAIRGPEDEETPTAGVPGADGMNGPGATPTPTASPNVRVVQAPAGVGLCPATSSKPQQLRSGAYAVALTAGVTVTGRGGERDIPQKSTVVVSANSTRTAQAGITDFVDPQGNYWATGASVNNSVGFTWSTEGAKDSVDVTFRQVDGPGTAMLFGPESAAAGLGDGDTGSLEAGKTGDLIFAFNEVGDYTVELESSGKTYQMVFAVGDTQDTSRSQVTSAILANCAGSAVSAELLAANVVAPPPPPDAGSGSGNTDTQATGRLGDEWWTISIAGIVLAAILVGFIVVVVVNSRRY